MPSNEGLGVLWHGIMGWLAVVGPHTYRAKVDQIEKAVRAVHQAGVGTGRGWVLKPDACLV